MIISTIEHCRRWDQTLDVIPLVSTATNLTYLVISAFYYLNTHYSSTPIKLNANFRPLLTHIVTKSTTRKIMAAIPFFGNVLIYLKDKRKEAAVLPNAPASPRPLFVPSPLFRAVSEINFTEQFSSSKELLLQDIETNKTALNAHTTALVNCVNSLEQYEYTVIEEEKALKELLWDINKRIRFLRKLHAEIQHLS